MHERWQPLIEARAMINFDHPNISRVRDVFKLKTQKVMGIIEEVYDEGTLLECAIQRDWRGELLLNEDKCMRILA